MSARLEPRLFEVVAIHYETAREISRVLFPVEGRGQKGLQDALWAARADAAGKSRVCGMAYVTSQVQRKWRGLEPGRLVIFRFGQEVTAEVEKQLWLPLGVVCEASGIALELRMRNQPRMDTNSHELQRRAVA